MDNADLYRSMLKVGKYVNLLKQLNHINNLGGGSLDDKSNYIKSAKSIKIELTRKLDKQIKNISDIYFSLQNGGNKDHERAVKTLDDVKTFLENFITISGKIIKVFGKQREEIVRLHNIIEEDRIKHQIPEKKEKPKPPKKEEPKKSLKKEEGHIELVTKIPFTIAKPKKDTIGYNTWPLLKKNNAELNELIRRINGSPSSEQKNELINTYHRSLAGYKKEYDLYAPVHGVMPEKFNIDQYKYKPKATPFAKV